MPRYLTVVVPGRVLAKNLIYRLQDGWVVRGLEVDDSDAGVLSDDRTFTIDFRMPTVHRTPTATSDSEEAP